MMATLANDGALLSGRFAPDGHILSATPDLLALHQRCGGGIGDPLALPGLTSLIRRAFQLRMVLSAPVLLADGPRNVTYWARTEPIGDAIELRLFDWNGGSGSAASPIPQAARERDFLRATSDWLWETDAALNVTALSEAATAVFEQPVSNLIGHPLAMLVAAPGRDGLAIDTSQPPSHWFDGRVLQTHGRPIRFFRLTATPVYEGDRLIGFRGVAVETKAPPVSAPPNVAENDEVDASSEFMAPPPTDMLRQPIEQIAERAEAMRDQSFGHLKGVYTGYAGDIATAARHLRTLIDDVFDVAAIDSGTMALAMDNVDLTTLAEEARAIVTQRAAEVGSKILWRAPPVSAVVRADRARALQILINLLQNAVKFAGAAGSIQMVLEMDQHEARLSIDDQGRGIAETDRERVFTKFERLQPEKVEGSGLGLFISRALARAMGGDIRLSASPEGGARFTFVLARA